MAVLVGFAGVVLFSLLHVAAAARDGRAGERSLLQAEHELEAQQVSAAQADLGTAAGRFQGIERHLHALGPIPPILKVVPLVGDEIRATEDLARIGSRLASAGTVVAGSAAKISDLESSGQPPSISVAMRDLEATDTALRSGLKTLDAVSGLATDLSHQRLIGPLASARARLQGTLPKVRARAVGVEAGLSAALAFAGADGPKNYLVLGQNPDEVRPTGGYIGTYGVMSASDGTLHLDRYDSIESWTVPRRGDVVPADQVTSVFGIDPRLRQSLADVNATADWPTAAGLASELWVRGGEQPVNGVVSFTPGLLGRLLAVVGPVQVPEYGQTVTAANALSLMDYYAHTLQQQLGVHRKDFIADLAQVLMPKLLSAPASQWKALGEAISAAFGAREAMAWSQDPVVQGELVHLGWAGTVPRATGDFTQDAEFEYMAKNGGVLHRVFTHQVVLHPDGSALVTTTMTISDTDATDPAGDLSYVTFYGPEGGEALISPDAAIVTDASLGGHPAQSQFLSVGPGASTTVSVAWKVPHLLTQRGDGSWTYSLRWVPLAGHPGDSLALQVRLPPGWRWDRPPPSRVALKTAFSGTWTARRTSR